MTEANTKTEVPSVEHTVLFQHVTKEDGTAEVRRLPPLPVRSIEQARALPEIHGDAVAYESDDPAAILAFKDADDRTMRVAVTVDGLAKIELHKRAAEDA